MTTAGPMAIRWPISIIVQRRLADVVVVGVEDLAEVALERVRTERLAERPLRDPICGREERERALVRGARREA